MTVTDPILQGSDLATQLPAVNGMGDETMPLSEILNTDPMALAALAGLALTVFVMLVLFGFLLVKLARAKSSAK